MDELGEQVWPVGDLKTKKWHTYIYLLWNRLTLSFNTKHLPEEMLFSKVPYDCPLTWEPIKISQILNQLKNHREKDVWTELKWFYCARFSSKVNSIPYSVTIKLTSTVAPFPIPIVMACNSTPWSIVVLSCTSVITTAFVDEREHTTVARCRSLPAMACDLKKCRITRLSKLLAEKNNHHYKHGTLFPFQYFYSRWAFAFRERNTAHLTFIKTSALRYR